MNSTASLIADASEVINGDDAAWILTCAFLILTMQTGFAMLETGCVALKNTANIMIKNFCDIVIGGLAFWCFGYSLAFGKPSNWFCGYGDFFYEVTLYETNAGSNYAKYFFQFSFASTATTIVSGAVAERMKLNAYMAFAFVNIIVYSIPACWCWNETGFLYHLGFFDFAGVCVVHMSGGISALVAAVMLGPRRGRFDHPELFQMSSPVTALAGMFMLTWAWLGFNCGSTFGVSGHKWKLAALTAVTTLNGGIGGGVIGLVLSMIFHNRRILIDYVLMSLLAGLVSVTGICAVTSPMYALFIGIIGGAVAICGRHILEFFKIDDPVGAVPVHLFASVWGTIAVGIFAINDSNDTVRGHTGLVDGGSLVLLGTNTLAVILVGTWSAVLTWLSLSLIKLTIGLRMTEDEEFLGADFIEHGYAVSVQDVVSVSDEHFRIIVASKFEEIREQVNKELKRNTETNSKHGNGRKVIQPTKDEGSQTTWDIEDPPNNRMLQKIKRHLKNMEVKENFRVPSHVPIAIRKVAFQQDPEPTPAAVNLNRTLRRDRSSSRISAFDFK